MEDELVAEDGGPGKDEPDEGEGEDEGEEAGPLFGRFDAAALLAVEAANGGEWAGLAQVLVTFHLIFGEWPDVPGFTESCGLLCEAGLVEYAEGGLGLLPDGRKLLRRAGKQGAASRPEKLTDLLAAVDELDLAEEGTVDKPEEEDVSSARDHLSDDVTSDLESVQASNFARLAGPPMMLPTGPLRQSHFDLAGGFGRPEDDEFDEESLEAAELEVGDAEEDDAEEDDAEEDDAEEPE
jgi:hypothetical protein